jgi:hypothetical protein
MFEKIIIFFYQALKDMSTKFKFVLSAPVKWPDRCVLCEKNPDEYNDLCGRVLRGKPLGPDLTSLLALRYPIKIVVSVPLCRRHCFQVDCIRFLYSISFWAAIIFGFLVCINSAKEPFPFLGFIVCLFLFFVSLGLFNLLPRLQPVRLIEVGDIFFTIVINDKDYAKEFESINDCHHKE